MIPSLLGVPGCFPNLFFKQPPPLYSLLQKNVFSAGAECLGLWGQGWGRLWDVLPCGQRCEAGALLLELC